jgi:hypothetical protein
MRRPSGLGLMIHLLIKMDRAVGLCTLNQVDP